jgi:hypothetical protein
MLVTVENCAVIMLLEMRVLFVVFGGDGFLITMNKIL